MPLYFAFGSNMSSPRLQDRVGRVEVLGRALLEQHVHAFDKLGRDGTGKGNIIRSAGVGVWGAVYRLSGSQLAILDGFEGGYERARIGVWQGSDRRTAETYVARQRHPGLRPADDYVRHYLDGVEEHGIPEDYLRAILSEAGLDWPERR